MPIKMFKDSTKDLGGNFIDRSSKTVIVNMTWTQTLAAKFL